MMNPTKWLLTLLILLAGGALTPPALHASGYLIFTSEAYTYPRISKICQMDVDGNIKYKMEFPSADGFYSAVSPDGRVVAVADWSLASVFFIGADGSIAPPVTFNVPSDFAQGPNTPVGFNRLLPLFYIGYIHISMYRYDLVRRQVELTSQSLRLDSTVYSPKIFHSIWCNSLVLRTRIRYYGGVGSTTTLQTVRLNPDGSFGASTKKNEISRVLSGL